MPKKFKDYLYTFDLLGNPPQLRIFNEDNYKSIFSSILSILLIAFSLIFSILSLIDYLKYKNPIVIYSKDNDKETNRSILLNDTLIIFALIENNHFTHVNKANAYFESEMTIEFKNKSSVKIPLTIENCEFGKNIDKKYIDSLYEIKKDEINKFYCFSKKDGDLSLFYDPNLGESTLYIYIKLTEGSNYTADDLIFGIINGNDIIEHDKKNFPISENYFTMTYTSFSKYKFTLTNFYFQFIKYESDEGLFFPSFKIYNAKAFSHMNNIFTNFFEGGNSLHIGTVLIEINKVNFDNYRRSYSRLQSLLAEIMSVISLLFTIGEIITQIFLKKKLNKDIVKYLIRKNQIYKINFENKEINNNQKYQNIEDSGLELKHNKKNSEKIMIINKNLKKENLKQENNIKIYSKISRNNDFQSNAANFKTDQNVNQDKINDINYFNSLDKLNYFDVLESYLCCKNNNSKLINLCDKLIDEDICLENILSRIYELENMTNILLKIEQVNYSANAHEKFKEIIKCIYEIEKKKLNTKN